MFALDSRQNAFFLLAPLWLLAWPIYRLNLRAILVSLVVGGTVFASAISANMWIDNVVLRSKQTHLIYALVIFDLAGISARTGQDTSHGLFPDFQANVEKCYTPHLWDAFLGECRPVGLAAEGLVSDRKSERLLIKLWIKEIFLNPIAYLKHRTQHFGCLIRLGCYDEQQVQMSAGFTPRPWDEPNMRVTHLGRLIAAMGWELWPGPLGYGVLWMAILAIELSIAVLLLRRRGFEPLSYLTMVLASAGLCYSFSFWIVGIGNALRYMHPVIELAIIGVPLTASCLLSGPVRHLNFRGVGRRNGEMAN
jgi:hypothetical protein